MLTSALLLQKLVIFIISGNIHIKKFISKILSPDSNYIVNVAMGPNFGNSSIKLLEL